MAGTADQGVGRLQPSDPRQLGPYELIGRLGVGAQGTVYLGRAVSGQRVAVKLLHPDLTEDAGARGRFVREAMAAKKVARFCAAQVLDVQVAGDRPYIVSEYVPGPSLYRLVKDNGPVSGGPLERLAIGTATALVAIHEAGIVHRDLKPANVLIGPDGPRVIDFGIAKAPATTATATSRVLGTPAYMAPEQIRGDRVDASVDVFAWGAMMAYVATGRPPFGTDSIPQVVQRILAAEPDLGGMVEPLRGLVRDCLAKDRAARPPARQILLRLLGQEAGHHVLAQAATLAGVPPSHTPAVPRTPAVPHTAGLTGPPNGAADTVPAPVPMPKSRPDNRRGPSRSLLSRVFVIAGLVAILVAIVALLLMSTKPYRAAGDPRTDGGTSRAQAHSLMS